MYKLIACDVDGTLLDSDFAATDIDKEAIKLAQEAGVIFTLCSGRSYKSLTGFAEELGVWPKGNYIIGFNGGAIYDYENKRAVRQQNLDHVAGLRSVELFKRVPRKGQIEIVVYTDAESIMYEKGAEYAPTYQETSKCNWHEAEDIVKATAKAGSLAKIIFLGENHNLQQLESELAGKLGDHTGTLFTAEYMLEVTPHLSTKANGVKWLCEKHGIDISETICIGDNHNDISMIRAAGLGVAVANAVDAAKDAADYITINNNKNGAVAEVISKFILNRH